MILSQNVPLKGAHIILMAANDGVRDSLYSYFNEGLEDHYHSKRKVSIKVAGYFYIKESYRSIFKYAWVELLDDQKVMKN